MLKPEASALFSQHNGPPQLVPPGRGRVRSEPRQATGVWRGERGEGWVRTC